MFALLFSIQRKWTDNLQYFMVLLQFFLETNTPITTQLHCMENILANSNKIQQKCHIWINYSHSKCFMKYALNQHTGYSRYCLLIFFSFLPLRWTRQRADRVIVRKEERQNLTWVTFASAAPPLNKPTFLWMDIICWQSKSEALEHTVDAFITFHWRMKTSLWI